jgi:hypothetical protein
MDQFNYIIKKSRRRRRKEYQCHLIGSTEIKKIRKGGTKEEEMKFKVGKRYLVVDVRTIYFFIGDRAPIEILILSITPSEKYIKVEYQSKTVTWEPADRFDILEELKSRSRKAK